MNSALPAAVPASPSGSPCQAPPDLLRGVRVIDLTTVVYGPLTTQMLADYGADVIKIESLSGDIMRHAGSSAKGGMGPIFLNLNRGKRSIALDLKREAGRDILRALLKNADVFVHNVRRAAIDRLGFSHEVIRAFNPGILYCSATGFWQGGRRADSAAIDDVIQSAAGMASINADSDGVPKLVQSLIADKVAGISLACAILAALYKRSVTGLGASIDVPMYETVASFMLLEHLQERTFDPTGGKLGYHRIMGDGRRIYRASDGFISMTPYSTEHWANFFRETGRPELADDTRITDPARRNAHVAELYDLIGEVAADRSVEEWEALAVRIGFPAQRVNDLAGVADDPDLRRSGVLALRDQPGVGPVQMLAAPGFFEGAAARHPGAAPRLGEHTRAVLIEHGIDNHHIDNLAAEGVIGLFKDMS
jgi:crotonobetainyl-CoA:carnitine CoA-transferase CaiB-like acyl-CoA transferase